MGVLYNLLKLLHILFAITAVGSNLSYGIWQGLAGSDPERNSFVLRGIKFVDDHVANPAYLLLLVSGLTLAAWHWSFTTRWIEAAIVLYVIVILFGFAVYSPALVRQIETLERDGITSSAYRAAAVRATVFGIAVMVPILGILFMMVVKPALG
jgi:uncharacterized membrane protein